MRGLKGRMECGCGSSNAVRLGAWCRNEACTTRGSGWVQVNQGGGQVVGQSYGGYKQSGIGREFSIEGAIEGFTQTKQINVAIGR